MKRDIARAVVVSAEHGEKFVGYVPDGNQLDTYFDEAVAKGQPVVLEEVRNLVTQRQPNMRGNEVVGMSTFMALLPIDMFPGAVPKFRVRPSSWYFPCDDPLSLKKMEELVKAAHDNEQKNRALEAGLSVPGRS